MIDKSAAERAAIRKGKIALPSCHENILIQYFLLVFASKTDAPVIRVCQFHIIQAIRRWNHEHFDKRKNIQGAKKKRGAKDNNLPSLPLGAISKVLDAFRSAQRCRDPSDWRLYQDRFESNLSQICQEYDRVGSKQDIITY